MEEHAAAQALGTVSQELELHLQTITKVHDEVS
jgi:hypothetical protein